MSKKHSPEKMEASRNPRDSEERLEAQKRTERLQNTLGVATGFGILMLLYIWMVGRFFPNAKGCLGSDYSYFGPNLLDGYYWFHSNGLFQVPWFTPSFCGGSLVFPNLQRSFYSFPQFLTFLVDPLTAIRTTVLVFAFLGGAGFYLLLRRAFRTSRWAAFLGGGLFLFNGFYSHRMIIGHFGFHTFMLLPLVALFLLRPLPDRSGSQALPIFFDATLAGTLVALMAMSDFVTLLIPALLSVIVLGLIHGLLHGQRRYFWQRLVLACSLALLLALAKLTAISAFMQNAPRSNYLLPGANSLLHSLLLVPRCLFVGAELDPSRSNWVCNAQWLLGQHEWEYSVSFVPLWFLVYGTLRLVGKIPGGTVASTLSRFRKSDWLSVAVAVVILLTPVLLNVYSPEWNAFLKEIPIIQSSSTLFRWFILYIPCVIAAAALIIERAVRSRYHAVVCIVSLACGLTVKASHLNFYYSAESYDPQPLIQAYHEVKSGARIPEITAMGMYVDNHGNPQSPLNRNDSFTRGISQILGYESLFGYRLEYLPLKTLHTGPALDTSRGVLNVKNPASYLWPDENDCKPGDHFKIQEMASAQAFLKYKPFPFRMSSLQVAANWTSLGTVIAVAIFQIVFFAHRLRPCWFSTSLLSIFRSPGCTPRAGRKPNRAPRVTTES